MKTMKLMLRFFMKNPFLLFFVLLEMLLTLALFVEQFGALQYETYTYDMYMNSDLSRCDHFSPELVSGLSDNPGDAQTTAMRDLYATEGVAEVGEIINIPFWYESEYRKDPLNTRSSSLCLISPSFFQTIPIELSDGSWFPEEDGQQSEVCVIAAGSDAENYNVGETVPLIIIYNSLEGSGYMPEPYETINVRIIGKLAEPAYFPSLRMSSTALEAADLFSSSGGLIVSPAQENIDRLSPYLIFGNSNRCKLIRYSEGLSGEELEKTRDSLRKWGILSTPEEIAENSRAAISKALGKRFSMVLFFLVISSFSMIASVIVTQMKMYRNNAIYYLCGATAPRCFFLYSGVPIMLIGLLAVGANLLRIAYMKANRLDIGIRNMKMVLNGTTAAALVAYFAVTVLVAILASYYVFRKNTPIESYRKNK